MKLCHFNCCDSCVSSCRMLCAIFASALATNSLLFKYNLVYFISLLCKLYCCYYFINVFFVQFVRKNIYRSKQKEYRMVTAAYSRLCQNVRPLLRMTFWISIFSTQKTTTPPYWSYSVRHIQCVFNSNKLLTHSAMCTMCAWVCMCVTVCTASACVFVCFDVYVTQLAKWREVAAYGWMDGWMAAQWWYYLFLFCALAPKMARWKFKFNVIADITHTYTHANQDSKQKSPFIWPPTVKVSMPELAQIKQIHLQHIVYIGHNNTTHFFHSGGMW